MLPLGQYSHPSHTIAHVSDTHLLTGGRLQYGAVDTVHHLGLALDRLDNKLRITQKLQAYLDVAVPKVEAWLKTQGNQVARGVRNVATEIGNAYDAATRNVGNAYNDAARAGAAALRNAERGIQRVQWRILSQF